MRMAGMTSGNCRVEAKPNEDYFCTIGGDGYGFAAAAVMDGIPVLRDGSGRYPDENGALAARIAGQTICECLSLASRGMQDAFAIANRNIAAENIVRKIYYEKEPTQWLSTVACAIRIDLIKLRVEIGYVGDPLIFVIRAGVVRLVNADQMWPFKHHLLSVHNMQPTGKDPKIRQYQDSAIRNRYTTQCFCGAPLQGFGELNGDPAAERFIETGTLSVRKDTRFILASDAIEAISTRGGIYRDSDDYRETLLSLDADPKIAIEQLVEFTRAAEADKGCRSDDATFVVLDV